MQKPLIIKLMLLSAIVLAVSYGMPVAYRPIVMGNDGEPAGFLSQAMAADNAAEGRDNTHDWEDLPIWTI